jgi:hypothetical protein
MIKEIAEQVKSFPGVFDAVIDLGSPMTEEKKSTSKD